MMARPICLGKVPIPSDARPVVNDRQSAPDDSVEERGLPDIGPADDRDDRKRCAHVADRASVTSYPVRTSAPPRPDTTPESDTSSMKT